MCISRLCTATWLRQPFCKPWTIRNPHKIDNAFMCAITVLLCHGNKELVCLLACVCACVRTCACDLSSKGEHQFKYFGRSRSPGIETHAHSHTIWTSNLFLSWILLNCVCRCRTCINDKVARKICIL